MNKILTFIIILNTFIIVEFQLNLKLISRAFNKIEKKDGNDDDVKL